MLLNKEILIKHRAPEEIIEIFNLSYPDNKDIDIIDIINDGPIKLVKWIEQFLYSPKDISDKMKERLAIKNSIQVYNSSQINNSYFIINSDDVKDSKHVSNSLSIENSDFVINSRSVKDSFKVYCSKYVFQSEDVIESSNINGSNNIRESKFVVNSSNILNGNNVNYSNHLLNCNNIYNSCLCSQVNNSKNCLFCCDLEEKEYYLFNKPISEQIYQIIFEQYQSIMNKQLILFKTPRNLVVPEKTKKKSILFSDFSKNEWQWVETLPNYDKDLMAYLTLQKYFIS